MSARDLLIRIKADASGLQAGIAQAQASVKKFGDEVDKSAEKRQALDTLGSGFMRAGLVAVAGSALAIKAAMDWEQAWTGVLKTVEGTDAQLAELEQSLRSLATTTGFPHEEVAAVAEAAGQLGISTGGIADFTETVLAMGVSTSLSAEEAAVGMARFRNIMGSSESEIQNIGSAMVGLGNNFATTESEILEMSMRLAGAGRQAGLSEADVLGLAAAMSSVGIEAEAGGTAMSLTMKRIGAEVDSQGPKLETFAQLAGMSAQDFSKAWKDDAAGALTSFIEGLDRAGASGESVNGILSDLGITGIREADALLRLSANAEGVADAIDLSSDAFRQNIALMSEADKFYNTTQNKIKQAWSSIKDAAISAGSAILPVVAKMAETVGVLADVFGSLPTPVLTAMTAIAGIGGTGLLAMAGLIKLHGAISETRAALDTLSVSGGKGGAAIGTIAQSAIRAAIAVAALYAATQAGEAVVSRGSKEISGLAKELEALGKSGKVGAELKSTFGEDLGGDARRFARDVRGIGEAIQEVSKYGDDGGLVRTLRRTVGGLATGDPLADTMYKAADGIRDLDSAMAELSRNDPAAAIAAFERLRDAALDQGAGIDEISRAFPTMTELLRGSSEAMGGASDASEVLAGDLQNLAPAAQQSAEALAAANEATTNASLSFFDMSAGLDDASLSLDGWIAKLAEMASAQQNWSQNVVKAMQRGVSEGVIAEFEKLGPAGARMLEQLVDGSQENIDRLNGMFDGVKASAADLAYIKNELGQPVITEFKTAGAEGAIETAVTVAEKYGLTPPVVQTILEALDYTPETIAQVLAALATVQNTNPQPNATLLDLISPVVPGLTGQLWNLDGITAVPDAHLGGDAPGQIDYVEGRLWNLDGASATVYINAVRTGASVGSIGAVIEKDGGVVDFYANGGMRENHVAQIAPAGAWRVWAEPETEGEAYIPFAASKRQRSLDIWAETGKRLGAQGFANGGINGGIGPVSASVGDVVARMDQSQLDYLADRIISGSQVVAQGAIAAQGRTQSAMRQGSRGVTG